MQISPVGWMVYGIPLGIIGLLAPWILARNGAKAFLAVALFSWFVAWFVANSLKHWIQADVLDMETIVFFAGYVLRNIFSLNVNNAVDQVATAIGFGLPVLGAMLTIWCLKKAQLKLLVQGVIGVSIGALLSACAVVVHFVLVLVGMAVMGQMG